MSDFLRVFLNYRSLKAATRDLTLEQLNEGFKKLSELVEERNRLEEASRAANAQRIRKIEEYKELLKAEGINVAELITITPTAKAERVRLPRPAKYKYTDLDGQERTWTGQGRQPSPISQAIASGKTLEDFLI